jgi:tRNA A-37 threonylcarbamoyl transferase component Bud32
VSFRVAAQPEAPGWVDREDGRAAFEAAWTRLGVLDDNWRGHRILPDAFVKGLEVPLVCSTQAWRRRWDIRHEGRNLAAIADQGAPVPELLAWGEELRAGLPLRGWLSTRPLADAESIAPVIVRHVADGTTQQLGERLVAVGQALRRFHDAGWVHLDLSVRNAVVQRVGDGWQGWIVDLARAERPVSRPDYDAGRRVDLYRLAKTAFRRKLEPEHVTTMIEAAAPGEGARITELTRSIRGIRNRYLRMARYHAWRRLAR